MLASLPISFLVGAWCGRVFQWPFLRDLPLAWVALLGIAIFACQFRRGAGPQSSRVVVRSFVIVFSSLWGFRHAAPQPEHSLERVTVVSAASQMPGRQTLLVQWQDHVFEATGIGWPGAMGEVTVVRRQTLLGSRSSFFRPFVGKDVEAIPESVFGRWSHRLRAWVQERSDRYGPLIGGWLRGLLVGDQMELPGWVDASFKRTGLYHLIVVSGSHVTFVAGSIALLLFGPFRLLYAIGWLSARRWVELESLLCAVAILGALLYAGMVGMPQSAQRAVFGFGIAGFSRLFVGQLTISRRLLVAGVAQAVFFPTGFLSISTLMSWIAYLFVVAAAEAVQEKNWSSRVGVLCGLQIKLTVIMAAFTSQLCLGGILANVLALATFPIVFLASVVLLVPSDTAGLLARGSVGIVRCFLDLVSDFNRFGSTFPLFVVSFHDTGTWARLLAAGLGFWWTLSALGDLSIRRSGPRKRPESDPDSKQMHFVQATYWR